MLRLKYLIYKIKWKLEHRGPLFEGMEPVCFSEWYYNEYEAYRGEKHERKRK